MSRKQTIIIQTLKKQPEITLDQAVRLIGGDVYANAPKHVGAVLARMVRRGMINRVRPAVFVLATN